MEYICISAIIPTIILIFTAPNPNMFPGPPSPTVTCCTDHGVCFDSMMHRAGISHEATDHIPAPRRILFSSGGSLALSTDPLSKILTQGSLDV